MVQGLKRAGRGRIWALVGLLGLIGCGGGEAPRPELPTEGTALRELGEMYLMSTKENHKPPESGKPLMKYMAGFSHGTMALKNRTLDVFWGAKIEPNATAVLAYERKAPESGGLVLLLDGETIKEMTVDEFKAAAKAEGKLEAAPKAKSKTNAG